MATFTMALREAIELTGGTAEIVNGTRKLVGGDIGLQHYPIFDEAYRDGLTGRIVDHYWNREIGVETVDMFQLAMRRKMNEIMPYFNKLYNSERIVFDPLSTVDMKTVSTGVTTQVGENVSESDTNSTSNGTSRTVSSDTPQSVLNGSGDYATALADAVSEGETTSGGTNTSTDNQTSDSSGDSTTTGYQGAASELLMRYRETLLNIDLMVIDALSELFMLIWDTGDTYYNNERGYLL